MNKKKVIILIIMLVFGGYILNAQTIKLVRTDVDAVRSNFVTATYMFGVDIVIEGVQNCNGVEFELAFNTTEFIHYSDWQVGGFGQNATTVVIPIVNQQTGQGRVYCLVISGEPISNAGISDTTVIHLDFVVSQKAPHGRQVTFSFINAHATVNNNNIGEVLKLQSIPFVYDIHGFVNVWPGDTDNNGVVDEIDMDKIALHLFHGAPTKNMRSFKRLNSSTLWHSQRVLAWDSAAVTFADCDGDGNITPYDMLVIPLNFTQTHGVKSLTPNIQSGLVRYNFKRPDNSIAIPLYINYDESFVASSLNLSWKDSDDFKIIGFEKGELFDSPESFIYANINEEDKTANVILGDYNKANKVNKSGNILYIIAESDKHSIELDKIDINDAMAMSDMHYLFPLRYNTILNVNEDKQIPGEYNIIQDGDILLLTLPDEESYPVNIYNVNGRLLLSTIVNNNSAVNINHINTGVYYLTIQTREANITKPLLIIR